MFKPVPSKRLGMGPGPGEGVPLARSIVRMLQAVLT